MNARHTALLAAAVLALGFAGTASAATEHMHGAGAAAPSPATTLTTGEVRKVDTAQGKVTIKHEPITNLDMPGMTMVFRAQKPELLKNIKEGDRIRFHAETEKGALIVTRIEK